MFLGTVRCYLRRSTTVGFPSRSTYFSNSSRRFAVTDAQSFSFELVKKRNIFAERELIRRNPEDIRIDFLVYCRGPGCPL